MSEKPVQVDRPRAWFSYIWLIYLGMPTYYICQYSAGKAATGLVLVVVFAALYVVCYHWRIWALYNGFVMIAIMAALALMFDPMMLAVGFFTISVAAFTLDGKRRQLLIASQAVMVGIVLLIKGDAMIAAEWFNLIPTLLIMFVFPFAFSAFRRTRQLRHELDSPMSGSNR